MASEPTKYFRLEDNLRFSVGTPEGAISQIWTIWEGQRKDDSFYATSDALKRGLKLSIHPEIALWGFTSQDYERFKREGFDPGGRRSNAVYELPARERNELAVVASITIPTIWEREDLKPWNKKKPVIYFPPLPRGKAHTISFQVGYLDGLPNAQGQLPKDANVLGCCRREQTGRTLAVVHTVHDFDVDSFLVSMEEQFADGAVKGKRLTDQMPEAGTPLGAVMTMAREANQPIQLVELSGMRKG